MAGSGTTITNVRMREIAMKSDTVAAINNAIVDFTSLVRTKVVTEDPKATPPRNKVLRLIDILDKPNPQTTGLEFKKMAMRDLAVFGYAAAEIVRGDKTLELWNVDAARLAIDYDAHGKILGYDQLDETGMPIKGPDGQHAWEADEIILFRHDPVSNSQYPLGRIEQLYVAAIIESLMLQFVGLKFTDSNVPLGLLDLGDLTEDDLEFAITKWEEQADSPHRLIITGSKGGAKFLNFHDDLQRLEAPALLADIRSRILSVYGATPNEVAIVTAHENNSESNLSYTFKKRCVEAYLATYESTLTERLLDDTLGYDDLKLSHDEVDAKDTQIVAQIDEIYLKNGVVTINELRSSKQLPPSPGGDEAYLYTPTGAIPVSLLADMAKAQLSAVQAAARQTLAAAKSAELQNQSMKAGAGPGSPVKPLTQAPQTRVGRPSDQTGSPDASRSGGTTIRLPHPNQQIKPGGGAQGNTGTATAPQAKPQHVQTVGAKKGEGEEPVEEE